MIGYHGRNALLDIMNIQYKNDHPIVDPTTCMTNLPNIQMSDILNLSGNAFFINKFSIVSYLHVIFSNNEIFDNSLNIDKNGRPIKNS